MGDSTPGDGDAAGAAAAGLTAALAPTFATLLGAGVAAGADALVTLPPLSSAEDEPPPLSFVHATSASAANAATRAP
jgi:hypothetical protein